MGAIICHIPSHLRLFPSSAYRSSGATAPTRNSSAHATNSRALSDSTVWWRRLCARVSSRKRLRNSWSYFDFRLSQPQFLHVEIPQNIVVGPQSGITSSPATSYLHSPYSAQGGHALSGTPIQSQTAALLQCPECAKRLRSKQSLNSHIEAIHRKNKRFSCPYCHRLFSFQQALRRHERESRCPSSRNLPS
ncbi:hypothetical protein F5879DRAFT_75796 [Lentinula edodes]|nr:hypothetical protein F5879DRAFT_75796 [Lentinula edodes]